MKGLSINMLMRKFQLVITFSATRIYVLVFIDLSRMIPSVIGNKQSVKEDSFFNGFKGPVFTRPENL